MGLSSTPSAELVAAHARAGTLLLPPGLAWTAAPGSNLRSLFEGFAGAWALLGVRVADLLAENAPETTVEMLSDWERVLGLPAPCDTFPTTTPRRRAALLAKLLMDRGPSVAAVLALAGDLGWNVADVSIVEEKAFRAGVGRAGDVLQGEDWAHVWRVVAPIVNPIFADCATATCTDALVDVDNDPLECFLLAAAPAHSILRVEFSAPYTGHAPWTEVTPAPVPLKLSTPQTS